MRIISDDGKRSIDVGSSDIWYSVYSTVREYLEHNKSGIGLAIRFMETGFCEGKDGYEIARQFNLIRDKLARIAPEKAVYDLNDKKKNAPWMGRISPIITSCANLYTTADGKDLLYEVVSIMCYAQVKGVNICIV